MELYNFHSHIPKSSWWCLQFFHILSTPWIEYSMYIYTHLIYIYMHRCTNRYLVRWFTHQKNGDFPSQVKTLCRLCSNSGPEALVKSNWPLFLERSFPHWNMLGKYDGTPTSRSRVGWQLEAPGLQGLGVCPLGIIWWDILWWENMMGTITLW